MRLPSRLHCALFAVALVPCWATAQSSLLGNTAADAPTAGSQLSTVPTGVADVASQQQGDASSADAVSLPEPNVETEIAAPAVLDASTSDAAANLPAATGGPTALSATSGIRSHVASENLTRRQLANRASNRDDSGGRNGLGRDAVLMIVGGAGIVAGALVGGSAGTALIIVGAVIGVTGLVLILS